MTADTVQPSFGGDAMRRFYGGAARRDWRGALAQIYD